MPPAWDPKGSPRWRFSDRPVVPGSDGQHHLAGGPPLLDEPQGCSGIVEGERGPHQRCDVAALDHRQQRRVTRETVSGLYLYTATDRDIQRGQLLTRRTVE